jgi:hypothetical protein
MNNSIDITGTRTHDIAACSAVVQPAALLRAPNALYINKFYYEQHVTTCIGSLSLQNSGMLDTLFRYY